MNPLEGHEKLRYESGRRPEERAAELAIDGVDAEVLFPNVGLAMWATPDAEFSQIMCEAWNNWAWESYGPHNDITFREGMFFTIEPMINEGKPGVYILDDGWTAVTRDKKLSAQFEHSIGVTADGVEIFTLSPNGWHQPPYRPAES